VTALLEIDGVTAGYGGTSVLQGVSLRVAEGEAVAIVGANAAGKTTLLKTIGGIVRPTAGSIRFGGTELAGLRPHEIAAHGVVAVAEGRQLFPRTLSSAPWRRRPPGRLAPTRSNGCSRSFPDWASVWRSTPAR